MSLEKCKLGLFLVRSKAVITHLAQSNALVDKILLKFLHMTKSVNNTLEI